MFFQLLIFSGFAQHSIKIDSILNQEKNYSDIIVDLRQSFSSEVLETALKGEDNEKIKIKLLNTLCWKNFNSNPQKALDYAKMQMELAEKTNDKDAVETGCDNFGFLYQYFGEYEKSLTYLLKSLQIKEAKNDSAGIAVCLNGIGRLYFTMENFPKALVYMCRALTMDSLLGNKNLLPGHYGNIGVCYANMKQSEKALQYYMISEHCDKELGQKPSSAILLDIGIAFMESGKQDKAEEYLFRSLETGEKNKDMGEIISANIQLGYLFGKKKEYEKAVKYCSKALELAKENDLKDDYITATSAIAEMYAKIGNFQKAFEYQKKYSETKDTLLSSENTRAIADMQTKYETEKKEKEILLLTKDKQLKDALVYRQKVIIWSVAGGVFLMILVALLIYRGYWLKKRANLELEKKNVTILDQKAKIEHQKDVIEQKNRDITDSIEYARYLQEAVLPDAKQLKRFLPESFICYLPKDIISGDFYWFCEIDDKIMVAACDCTGHGVPGALLSVLCNNLLYQAVFDHGKRKPGEILSEVNRGVLSALKKEGATVQAEEGMDASLCVITNQRPYSIIEFAGANHILALLKNQNIIEEIRGDFTPVGGVTPPNFHFTNHTVEIDRQTTIFMSTDGYYSQFGGLKSKKLNRRGYYKILHQLSEQPPDKQQKTLHERFIEWKGDNDQVDDVLVIGINVG